ncbi:MAG: hypothetical protein ACE5GG_00340 [Candidatus Omnitrophota bacterium]
MPVIHLKFHISQLKKGQALVELALFGSLLLIIIGALFSYTQNIYEQQRTDIIAFRSALERARSRETYYKWEKEAQADGEDLTQDEIDAFLKRLAEGKATDEEKWLFLRSSGARLDYSLTRDKGPNFLFRPERTTYSSSYSVYWSGAPVQEQLNVQQINDVEIDSPRRYQLEPRSNASEPIDTPINDKRIWLSDIAPTLYPLVIQGVGALTTKGIEAWGQKNGDKAAQAFLQAGNIAAAKKAKKAAEEAAQELSKKIGTIFSIVGFATRAYVLAKDARDIQKKLKELKDIENRDARLEEKDRQMRDQGYHIASRQNHDDWEALDEIKKNPFYAGYGISDMNELAGKYYIKELIPQIYDTPTEARTVYAQTERRGEGGDVITNRRKANLTQVVRRTFRRRYDTTPDPNAITRTYEDIPDLVLQQALTLSPQGQPEYRQYSGDVSAAPNIEQDIRWVTGD